MRNRIMAVGFLAALAVATLAAQNPNQATPAIPNMRGVFYRTGDGFVGLQSTFLLPMEDGNLRWILSLGHSDAIAATPGPHSAVQTSSAKPTLYVRGFPASAGIYLVREIVKPDYRELHMPVQSEMVQWTRFRKQDLIDLDIKSLIADVLEVTPKTNLTPGEYAIISQYEPQYHNIKVSFDFGVRGQ